MVRKLTTTVTIGLLALGETMLCAAPTPARRPDSPAARVGQRKPVPVSRLVRPKPVSQVEPRVRNRFESAPEPEPAPEAEPPPAEPADDLLPDLRETPNLEDPEIDALLPETAPLSEAETLPEPVEREEPTPEIPEVEEPAMETPAPAPVEKAAPQAPAAPADKYFRLEPPNKLVPVEADALKPGCIYQHTSPTLGRPVWSFVQANGEFWHAFGPGTTQAVEHFDFRLTDEEIFQRLKKIDPKLAFDVSSKGSRVFLRLQPDNTWKLVHTNSVPSIYDIETSQHWEKQWGRYLPVMHLCGDTWEYREGKYEADGGTVGRWDDGTVGRWDGGTRQGVNLAR